jgi:glycosyltransferase involved in cell wall biosynthesis
MTLSQNREDIKTAIREGICDSSRIGYIGNGIDLGRFDHRRVSPLSIETRRTEFHIRTGDRVVGFVGRLVQDKGLLELFEAARMILEHEPRVRFLIIGQPDQDKPDALTPEDARKHGIFDSCIFAGQREDMPELYSLMDVFVLPSHREGFPRAPMEAGAMGVPCVLTDVRGCREVVEHNRNGLLVPLRNPPALAKAVIRLLTDKETATRMGKEAVRIAHERFDERVVFDKIKVQYARLITAKGFQLPSKETGSVSRHAGGYTLHAS